MGRIIRDSGFRNLGIEGLKDSENFRHFKL
jgi:hypothetical protein